MAHCYIEVIAAEANLITAGYYSSILGDTGIYSCLAAAGADRFDLGNRVRNLKEAHTAGEKLG